MHQEGTKIKSWSVRFRLGMCRYASPFLGSKSFDIDMMNFSIALTNLIPPFVDDWHVDVVDEYRHLSTCRRSERTTHPLVDVAFYGPLEKYQTSYSDRLEQSGLNQPGTYWAPSPS